MPMTVATPAPLPGSKPEAATPGTMPRTITLPINRATGTLAICAVVTLWLAPYGHLSHRLDSGLRDAKKELTGRMESMEARLLQGQSETNRKLDALLLYLIPEATP